MQLPPPFSKTGFLRRYLIVLLNFSAKTAPRLVLRLYLLMLFLFLRLVRSWFTNSFPSSVSIIFGDHCEEKSLCSNESLLI